MKIFITDRQRGLILKESKDNLNTLISHWKKQQSKGKQIRFDKDELEYWGIDGDPLKNIAQIKFQELVGDEFTDKFIRSLIGKEFSTEEFNESMVGGYNFKWVIDNVEYMDFDYYLYYLYGHILPGGSVSTIDGRTLSLSEALEDEDIGWEIEGEINDVVSDCTNSIILPIIGTKINGPLMKLPEE